MIYLENIKWVIIHNIQLLDDDKWLFYGCLNFSFGFGKETFSGPNVWSLGKCTNT